MEISSLSKERIPEELYGGSQIAAWIRFQPKFLLSPIWYENVVEQLRYTEEDPWFSYPNEDVSHFVDWVWTKSVH